MISSELSAADIAAVTGNRGNGGFGSYGNNFEWIIILFLFAMFGGWGGNRGFGGGGYSDSGLYPWLNQSNQINNGFQNQMLNDNVVSIRDGIYGIGTQLCNGFAGVNNSISNGFAQAEIANNARQMADMQQMFGLQSQLAQCCCDNRLATCQTQNIVQNEGNITRFADANNTRDIIESNNQGFQKVMDKLCQLELDGVKGQLAQAQRENVGLQNQLNMASFRESQANQNALFAQGLTNEVDALYNRLSNCPVPTTPVYGRTPIFTCNGNQTCGCNAVA